MFAPKKANVDFSRITSKTSAMMPAAIGDEAEVPVWEEVHLQFLMWYWWDVDEKEIMSIIAENLAKLLLP